MDAVDVVGAGGIGCAVGHALLSLGVRVRFVEANRAKREAGARDGVRVAGHEPIAAEFVAFEGWQPEPDATVLLCVKSYDNPAVLARVGRGARLVPIQNGFDPLLLARDHPFEAIASFVSECEADRPWTRITRPGHLHLGARPVPRGPSDHEPPASLRALAGSRLFELVRVDQIEPYKHAKLMYNAAVSPLAAAGGIDNGKLLADRSARRLFFALLRENHAILSAAGGELGRVGPLRPEVVARVLRRPLLANLLARAFEPSLRGTYCSMAGEIQKGRTEIDHYNGYLVRRAEAAGVPCPLNRAVLALVSGMTARRELPSVSAWAELAAA
jgi:2-dehydropantoate 2-reductase